MSRKLWLLAACCLLSAKLFAQTQYSAEGVHPTVWVGAEISTFNPDYGCRKSSPFSCWTNQLIGITPYAEAHHLLFRRLGAEGEARFLHWRGPGVLTETSYLAGPRIDIVQYRRLLLGAKIVAGIGHFSANGGAGEGNYFVYAPGATLDYRLSRKLSARVDYEYQEWPSFKGSGTGTGGLTPNGLSFGISYAVIR